MENTDIDGISTIYLGSVSNEESMRRVEGGMRNLRILLNDMSRMDISINIYERIGNDRVEAAYRHYVDGDMTQVIHDEVLASLVDDTCDRLNREYMSMKQQQEPKKKSGCWFACCGEKNEKKPVDLTTHLKILLNRNVGVNQALKNVKFNHLKHVCSSDGIVSILHDNGMIVFNKDRKQIIYKYDGNLSSKELYYFTNHGKIVLSPECILTDIDNYEKKIDAGNIQMSNVQKFDDDSILYLRNGSICKLEILPDGPKDSILYEKILTYTIYNNMIYIVYQDSEVVCRYNDTIPVKYTLKKLGDLYSIEHQYNLMNVDEEYIIYACVKKEKDAKLSSTIYYMMNKPNNESIRELKIELKGIESCLKKIVGIKRAGKYYYVMMSAKSLYLYRRVNGKIEYLYDVFDREASYGILTVFEDSIVMSNKGTIYDLFINI